MTRESLIERIRKLLALAADNPSAAEATAAALKAQRLIADNDVSKHELYDEKAEEISEVYSDTYKGNLWSLRLARVIADNFRCQLYRHHKAEYGGGTNNIVFVGYETDAQAATLTFNRLFEIGNRLADAEARAARRTRGTAAGVKDSYLMGRGDGGFVGGIRSELEKQSHELMIVRPQAVDDYFTEATRGFGKVSQRRRSYSEGYESKGYRAGRDALRSARMGGQMALEG